MALFSFLESGDQDSETAVLKRNKEDHKNAEEEEETPPPLPPRRRLEATDEPVTKKSRTSDHGMSKVKHITKKTETNKNKSKMRHLFRFVARGRKRQNDDTAARQSSEGTGRLGLLGLYFLISRLMLSWKRGRQLTIDSLVFYALLLDYIFQAREKTNPMHSHNVSPRKQLLFELDC